MKVRIENTYTDGHESTNDVDLGEPREITDEWWQDVVFDETGDGHYTEVYEATGERLGSCSTATIIEANNPTFVGLSHDWLD